MGPIPKGDIFDRHLYANMDDLRVANYEDADIQSALGLSAMPSWKFITKFFPRSLTCAKCLGNGHLADGCIIGIRCFTCKNLGHTARVCPSNDYDYLKVGNRDHVGFKSVQVKSVTVKQKSMWVVKESINETSADPLLTGTNLSLNADRSTAKGIKSSNMGQRKNVRCSYCGFYGHTIEG